ncbi:MAG: phosphate ABC transporter permease PstA [Bacteroidetes bacterium]|nr:phosphate ABC transporter permease PstA [Bacteroidota bacterium]MBP7397946.1 phosphate ABC transporter permease PstA [Chitinophagales bacterium]MBK7108905.1 phosphate ABC transporter permease PstA [Bacteroidota bacterium]MBK8488770.1 phosphate ABC transporter permease PstA [Bacteroidota bacterium]MBK8681473.1 phosphate ABC transporter permease PstA [Bacteroidota bacterium]
MNKRSNRIIDSAFKYWAIFCTVFGLAILFYFIINIIVQGAARIDWDFLTNLPSRKPENSGIFTAIMGTIWILVLTAIISIPIGVGAGIYLEEYGKRSRLNSLLEINITNLAGVPSVIYGILGLEVFVRSAGLGGSVLTGALTLGLLILPVIIVATREAIKAVPHTIKEASFALGASKWQTIYRQILPAASGGIITGVILALSRAIGETAPLIVVGALMYVPFAPSNPMDEYSVMPMQIFNWISRPQAGFATNAAAAIIVLLIITFIMNGFAIFLRNSWQKKVKW